MIFIEFNEYDKNMRNCHPISAPYRGVLRLLGAGIALMILCSNFVSAAPIRTPGNIGKSWPNRRPMGRLIFAQVENSSPSNLNGWLNGGPTVLGVAAFQADILSMVNHCISNVIRMHGQGIIIWDITGCGKTTSSLGDEEYLGDPRFLDPRGSGLTVKTAYGPYVPLNSALGINGIERFMNSIADRIFASIRSAGLTCGVALRAEKVSVNSKGQLDGSVNDGQLIYDTVRHQLADLDAKLVYAYKRWGCRIFYVDSNAYSQDILTEQQNQLNPTEAAAYVYTQLHLRHPDCLICPEETYTGAFAFPPLINDPAFQYDRVTARYSELRSPWTYPFVGYNETSVVPDTFTLISASDMGTSDPADTPSVIAALKANQCILMADAWYDDPAITLINNWRVFKN
jgi:hypothetical protein